MDKASLLLFFSFVSKIFFAQSNLEVNVDYLEASNGRVLLLVSNDFSNEPRFQITDDYKSQIVVGVDVFVDGGNKPIIFPHPDQTMYPILKWTDCNREITKSKPYSTGTRLINWQPDSGYCCHLIKVKGRNGI